MGKRCALKCATTSIIHLLSSAVVISDRSRTFFVSCLLLTFIGNFAISGLRLLACFHWHNFRRRILSSVSLVSTSRLCTLSNALLAICNSSKSVPSIFSLPTSSAFVEHPFVLYKFTSTVFITQTFQPVASAALVSFVQPSPFSTSTSSSSFVQPSTLSTSTFFE